jgi:hypothetical protein
MSSFVLEDGGRRFHIDPNGLVTEVKASGDVIPWTQQGRMYVVSQLERIFDASLHGSIRDAVSAMPEQWPFVVDGIKCDYQVAFEAVRKALDQHTQLAASPLRMEAGFVGPDSLLKVFLQQGGVPGAASRTRKKEYLQLHATDAIHFACALAALYEVAHSENSILAIHSDDDGHDVRSIDVSDKPQVNALFTELQLPLDDLELCKSKGLLAFTTHDMWKLAKRDSRDVDF